MTGARVRGTTVLVLLALNAMLLLAWSQQWATARAEGSSIPVAGSVAGGAELPLALTGLVLVAALLLAGPVFRVILGVLQSLLGLCTAVAGALVIADPVSASRHSVSEQTGLTGTGDRISATLTAWPAVALALGVLVVLAGIGVAATARRWPTATSRFERTRIVDPDAAEGDPIREWDALSEGDDPTSSSR